MTRPITNKTQKKFFLIDGSFIQEGLGFDFNIYCKDSHNNFFLLYKKNTPIMEAYAKKIIEKKEFYIHEKEREAYSQFHQKLSQLSKRHSNLEESYQRAIPFAKKLFQGSVSTVALAETVGIIHSLTMAVIEKDDPLSSVITSLMCKYQTSTHSLHVCIYSLYIGKELQLAKEQMLELGMAAFFHDIGKSKISQAILEKKGYLTPREYEEVKHHSLYGWSIAKSFGITNKGVLQGIRNHHERSDGTGYPDGLHKREIHLYAKIIAVCDVFDALTTQKSYKDSKGTFETLLMMKKEMHNHLDTHIVNAFITIFRKEHP